MVYVTKIDTYLNRKLRYLCIFLILLFINIFDLSAQQRVFFKEKSIEEIGFNIPLGVGMVSAEQAVFPEIWENSDFGYAGTDFIFSGYYTVVNTKVGENITEGEIKLIRTTQFEMGGKKEILIFNIKNAKTYGKIQYSKFYTESDDLETDPFEKNSTWVLESKISAYASQSGYINIKYSEIFFDENGVKNTINIDQKSGSSIALSYFRALINWNDLKPDEKPIIKKIKS